MSSRKHISIGGVLHTVIVIWRRLECGLVRDAVVTSDDPRGFMFDVNCYPGDTAAEVAEALRVENPTLVKVA